MIGARLLHLVRQSCQRTGGTDAAAPGADGASHPWPQPDGVGLARLRIGAPAPAFALAGLHGETQTLDALRADGRPVMLLFVDLGYRPSRLLLVDLARSLRSQASPMRAVAIVGDAGGRAGVSGDFGLVQVLIDRDGSTTEAYGIAAVPAAVLVGVDGTIGSDVGVGVAAIRRLVAAVEALHPWPPVGPRTAAGQLDVAARQDSGPQSADGGTRVEGARSLCEQCLDHCQDRGGGGACGLVCQMAGACQDLAISAV